MSALILIVRSCLALVFVVAGVTKLADREGTRRAVTAFGIPEALAVPVGLVLPFVELTAAVLLVPGALAWWGAVLAIVLLGGFCAAIAVNLARGNTPDCHCFGQIHSEPIGRSTLLRNAVLIAAAGFVLAGGPVNRDPEAFRQLGSVTATNWIAGGAAAAILALVATQLWLLVRVLRQNEQLLIRLKMVEADVRGDRAPTLTAESVSDSGLQPGSDAPSFELPDLAGKLVTLESLTDAGKPVVLLFTSPNCIPCNALMPDIRPWQNEFGALVDVVVVASGDKDDNRAKAIQHGLSTVLLQRGREVEGIYGVEGTPSAVVVRPDGTVGSPVAAGPDAIRLLLTHVLSLLNQTLSLQPSLIRESAALPPLESMLGPYVGGQTPSIELPSLQGDRIDVAALPGEKTVVLFYNTGCSWCGQLLPSLLEWEADPPDGAPKLVVIATGQRDDIAALGFSSLVLLDPEFSAGRAFDIGGTPLAALLDETGTFVTRVAGERIILALLSGEFDWPYAAASSLAS